MAFGKLKSLLSQLEVQPELGYPLKDEWEGCWAAHVGNDRYRVIWEPLDPIEDYAGQADLVIPVYVLRVGPKTDAHHRTIYERAPRPPSPNDASDAGEQ